MVKCPRCGIEVNDLHAVDSDLMTKLQGAGIMVPEAVCMPCMSELRKTVGRAVGGILLAQERAQEHHRMQLWKSRVQLVRKARSQMTRRAYAEAAISYEKYLKILEIVFQLAKGTHLTPGIFKDNARTSELTVVASVYWDLLRIYDTNSKYTERQRIAAHQLAAFIKFTPIFPDILKRAHVFVKQAKHPEQIRAFLKAASETRPRCFVATAAFESPWAAEVQILRFYRDRYLQPTRSGRMVIKFYYRFSPRVARVLDRSPRLKPLIRGALKLLIKCVGLFALATSADLYDL